MKLTILLLFFCVVGDDTKKGDFFMKESKMRVWIEGAFAAAFAMALSFIPLDFGPAFSISIGMVPVLVYTFRRGTLPGLASGLIWGLLHVVLGKAYILTVSQGLIEYFLAFPVVGLSGLYAKPIQKSLKEGKGHFGVNLLLGVTIGTFARYLIHFWAGVLFWGQYAMWGLGPVVYSLVINGLNGLVTGAATYIILLILAKKNQNLFLPK